MTNTLHEVCKWVNICFSLCVTGLNCERKFRQYGQTNRSNVHVSIALLLVYYNNRMSSGTSEFHLTITCKSSSLGFKSKVTHVSRLNIPWNQVKFTNQYPVHRKYYITQKGLCLATFWTPKYDAQQSIFDKFRCLEMWSNTTCILSVWYIFFLWRSKIRKICWSHVRSDIQTSSWW